MKHLFYFILQKIIGFNLTLTLLISLFTDPRGWDRLDDYLKKEREEKEKVNDT